MAPAANVIDATIFGTAVRVMIGTQQSDGMLPISAQLIDKTAYHRFLEFDPDTSIIRVEDQEEYRRFLSDCHGPYSFRSRFLRYAVIARNYIVRGAFGAIGTVFEAVNRDGLAGFIVFLAYTSLFLPIGLFGLVVGAPFVLAGRIASSAERKLFDAESTAFLKFVARSMHVFWNGADEAEPQPELLPAHA